MSMVLPFRDARHLVIATSLTASAAIGRGPPLSRPAARNGSWSPHRGVPDNGGLVLAGAGGQSLITGLRPSQYLTFSPLPATSDDGRDWPPESPVRAAPSTRCPPPACRCGRARYRPCRPQCPCTPRESASPLTRRRRSWRPSALRWHRADRRRADRGD